MQTCFVQCRPKSSSPVRTFEFPRHAPTAVREAWLNNIPHGITRPFDTYKHRICVRHFEDKYLIKDTSIKFGKQKVSPCEPDLCFLALNAIPTIFDTDTIIHNTSQTDTKTSSDVLPLRRKRRAPSEPDNVTMKYDSRASDNYEHPIQPSKLCLLCRDQVVRKPRTGVSYELWMESCATSLRDLLELDESFQNFLCQADYCDSCLFLVRDIDCTLKNISSLQNRLTRSRQKVESLLRNNVRVAKRNETNLRASVLRVVKTKKDCEDVKTSAYDLTVKSIWEALPNIMGSSSTLKQSESEQKPKEPSVPVIINVTSKAGELAKVGPGLMQTNLNSKVACSNKPEVQISALSQPHQAVVPIPKHPKPKVTFQPLSRFMLPFKAEAEDENSVKSSKQAVSVPVVPPAFAKPKPKPKRFRLPSPKPAVDTTKSEQAEKMKGLLQPNKKLKQLLPSKEIEELLPPQTNNPSPSCSAKTGNTSITSLRPWRLTDEVVEAVGILDLDQDFPSSFGFGIF